MLSRYGISFERVEGINGFDTKNSQDFKRYASQGLTHPWEKRQQRKRIGSPGEWGCLLSHKQVITKAKQEGLKRILILEDDAIIREDFSNLFPQVIAELPEDWKLFYLGCVQLSWVDTQPYSQHLYHPEVRAKRTEQWSAVASFAYALDASVFDLVLDLIETAEWGYDLGPLNDLMLRFPQQTFAANPHLFAADYYKSTICNARTSQHAEAWATSSRWEMNCYEPYVDPRPLRVVALLAVRNEERYLSRCLQHLHHQGIETCLIDNGSTDRTLEIAESFRDRGVFQIEHFPFHGVYEWTKILKYKEQLATEIDADWFIHCDADEIREAPKPYMTLVEGIEDADRQGFNAINFKEFSFLPTSDEENFEGKDYVAEMKHYLFFRPCSLFRVNAWKKTSKIDLHTNAGHRVEFDNVKVFPVEFILRHYIILSKNHAIEKYGDRVFFSDELAKGWHTARAKFSKELIKFPRREHLKAINHFSQWDWDTSEPWEFDDGFLIGQVDPPHKQTKHSTIPVQERVIVEDATHFRLAEIQASLEQSSCRLSQIKANLKRE